MIYLQLFFEFFRAGLFAVGGGMATLPFLSEMGSRLGWFTTGQLADMVAVSESTPGPIGVNMATYVGYSLKGIPGGIVATLGLITPSVIIILIVARVLDRFRKSRLADGAFYGIRPASTAMIGSALLNLIAVCMFGAGSFSELFSLKSISGVFTGSGLSGLFSGFSLNIKYWILFALLMVLTNIKRMKKLHPLVFIAFAAVCGIVFGF